MTSTPTAPTLGHALLGGRPGDLALVSAERNLTYAELAAEVHERIAELGGCRRVVLLEAANDVGTVVDYLAALAGRHPVLLTGADSAQVDIMRTYAPHVLREGPQPEPPCGPPLHEDLALLLSTSGTTGSPKLVRLSHQNLIANARSIADYLSLRSTDRAITSLPLHYCYGLSVLNSHLVAGAAVVLTEHSVTNPCFWELVDAHAVTGLAGVPYTFDLLDVSGFADRDLPHLRYLTQAGGRMAPETVVRYAEQGQRSGWELFVMYGQTEATARMAYLPPDLAAHRPTSIGIPIPGGELRLDALNGTDRAMDSDVGELVYSGPNVMMGYAHGPADLARGHDLTELRTGDLARQGDDGLFEITGRLGRTAKVFGLRVDLDRLERQLEEGGVRARVVADDARLHAFVSRPGTSGRVRALVASLAGVPPGSVTVHTLTAMPMTASGKGDYAALSRHVASVAAVSSGEDVGRDASIADLYAVALGRTDVRPSDSFISLGGDSLSFVEVSTRLARRLGHLPADWPHRSIDDLTRLTPRTRRLTTPLETSIVLRAVAIVLVVTTHTDLWLVPGGAHVLLAVAGYNLARFLLVVPGRVRRGRRIVAALGAVALPASAWILASSLVTGEYHLTTGLYLNGLVGPDHWTVDWRFWFLEVLVWSYVAIAALLLLPVVERWQRRHGFAAAMTVVAVTLALRYLVVGVEAHGTDKYTVVASLWVLALGWAAAEARTAFARVAVMLTAALALAGFFDDAQRALIVAAGFALLLWARTVPVPRVLATPAQLVAAASLWIYLTHWEIYPALEAAGHAGAAIAASVVIGIACHVGYGQLTKATARRRSPGRWWPYLLPGPGTRQPG